ncbi:flagellar FLiS export co-chaperone [Campylobacter sp. VTCC 70190]|uniref:flagellar FLiS export co-chaperone n=1 Tax=Campylobacter sp. VTCC 70190 TaxID=3392118 RepID=UPI00398E80D5
MKNDLAVFKKHLGEVAGVNEFKASQICSQINDANDFIGALQVLDMALKKIEKSILERRDENLDDMQKRTLDAMTSQLIQNCSFMGTALFGNIFKVYVGQKLFEFEIANPLLILQTSDYEGVLAYIQDKRAEIKGILSQLASAITMGETINNSDIYNSTGDFKNLFK